MKNKIQTITVNTGTHMLSELVEQVKQANRRAAIERYLNSDTHTQLMIVGSLIEQCEESQRSLLEGEISPHLDVCCCAGTFASALTSFAWITYTACDLPEKDRYEDELEEDRYEDELEESNFIDKKIDGATFARLAKRPVEKLLATLVEDYDCSEGDYEQMHESDGKAQQRYYKAVCSRFEAAAQYAKAIGSDSARLWLEALCLLSPKSLLRRHGNTALGGLNLDPDCVAKAYEVAERAQRALWVDDTLRKLPAAKLPRKTKR